MYALNTVKGHISDIVGKLCGVQLVGAWKVTDLRKVYHDIVRAHG